MSKEQRGTNTSSRPTQNINNLLRGSQGQGNQITGNQNFVDSKLLSNQRQTAQDLAIVKNQTEQDQITIENLKEEILTLRNTVNEYEQLLDSERNTILFLQNQIAQLNNTISLKNDDQNNKSRRIIELERELDESAKRLHDLLQYQDSQNTNNLNQYNESVKNQQEFNKLENNLKEKERLIVELQKKLAQQKIYIEQVQTNFKNDYQQLLNQNNDFKRENYESRNQLSQLLTKHNDLNIQHQNLQSFHDNFKDEHRAEVERLQSDFQNEPSLIAQNQQQKNQNLSNKQVNIKNVSNINNISNTKNVNNKQGSIRGSQINNEIDIINIQYAQQDEQVDVMDKQTHDYLLQKIKRLEEEIKERQIQQQKLEDQKNLEEKGLEKNIDDLNAKIRQMQLQEREQQVMEENLDSENAEKINQLMRQLYESQSMNQKLQNDIQSLQQLNTKMGQQVDRLTGDKSSDLKMLERQIHDNHQKLLKYESEISKLQKKINSMNFDLKYRDDMFKQKFEDMQCLQNIKVTEAVNLQEMLDRKTYEAKNHHFCEQKITALSTENGTVKQELIQRRKIIEDLKNDRVMFEKQRDQDIKDAITQTKNNMKLLADKEIRDVKVKYDEKIDEYLLQIEKQKSDLKYQNEKCQELKDDNENIGRNLSKYNQQAEEWRMRYTEVRRDNILPQSLQKENEELQRQIDEQKEIIFRLQKELEDLQNNGQDLDKLDQEKQGRDKDAEIDYLRQQLKQKDQELQEKEKFAQYIKIENAKILDNNIGAKDAIKGQLLIWQKEKKDMEQLIQQLRGDVVQSKSSITMAYGQNTQQIKDQELKIRTMEQDIIILRDGNDEAYEIIHQLEEQIFRLQQSDQNETKDDHTNIINNYDKVVTDMAILKKTMFQIDLKNDQLTKENERLKDMQQKYMALERQNKKLKADFKLYTGQDYDLYMQDIENKGGDLHIGNQSRVNTHLESIQSLEVEKTNLVKQNQEQQKMNNDLKNQLQKAQQEISNQILLMRENKDAEQVINRLKKELRDQQELINKMKQQIQKTENDQKKLQKENQSFQTQMEQLRIQIETTLNEKNNMQSQIDDIQFSQVKKTSGRDSMAYQVQGLEKQLQEYQRDRQLLHEMRKDYEILGNELLERDQKIRQLQQLPITAQYSSISKFQQQNDQNDWMKKETYYREKILELEDAIEKLMNQNLSDSENTNQLNIQISELMRQIQSQQNMKNELDEYKRKCESFSVQINSGLRSSLDQRGDNQIELLRLKLVKQREEYEGRLDELKAKIVTLEAQLVYFKENHEMQRFNRIEIGSSEDKIKTLLVQAEKDIETWRLKYFSQQEILQSEIQRLESLNQNLSFKNQYQVTNNQEVSNGYQINNGYQVNINNQEDQFTKNQNVKIFTTNYDIENLRIQNKILEDKNNQITNINNQQFTGQQGNINNQFGNANFNYTSYSSPDNNIIKIKNNELQQLRYSSNQVQIPIRQPESSQSKQRNTQY